MPRRPSDLSTGTIAFIAFMAAAGPAFAAGKASLQIGRAEFAGLKIEDLEHKLVADSSVVFDRGIESKL